MSGTYVEFKRRGGCWRIRVAGTTGTYTAFTARGARRVACRVCKLAGLQQPMFTAANPENGGEDG